MLVASLLYSVASLPSPGSRHCSLVRRLEVTDNPAMCFSEPECGQQCSTVDTVKCQTVQDRECKTVNQNKCFNVQQQVSPDIFQVFRIEINIDHFVI